MPLYSYTCDACGASKDEFRKIDERNKAPDCDLCKLKMKKIISGYSVVNDVEPYYDDNLQSYVKSKQHRKALMKEQGVAERFGKRWM